MENNQGAFTRLDDEACGKLWEIYLGEAERYDEGLVKSWKEDMDVILVFVEFLSFTDLITSSNEVELQSGLYSAVLTAFVIESYKNLQPDPAEQSVTLLLHLSGQLASLGNTSAPTSEAAALDIFSVSVPAVACNVLWFLSLSLALCCAFLATFVQQWTRHFLHRTTILRSPTARAYLFSFLYFGLKDYGMHTIVDIIPSLLHLSLFAFFAGLVAFLHPINSAVRWLIIGTLIAITCVYTGFTIMPVITLNSPFQTPLSPMVWRMWQLFYGVFGRALISIGRIISFRMGLKTSKNESITEGALPITAPDTKRFNSSLADAMIVASHQNRQDREWMSLAWTLRSLNDDTELLPFIEALPNVLYSSDHGIHSGNVHLLKPLLETTDPQIDIIARIDAMMDNVGHPWFSDNHRQRCQMACPKALWTIAYVLKSLPGNFELSKTNRLSWFGTTLVAKLSPTYMSPSLDKSYSIPAYALIRSSIISCAETFLRSMLSPSTGISSSSSPQFPITYKDFAIFVGPDLLITWREGEDSYQMFQETTSIDRRVADSLLAQCTIEHSTILTDFLRTSATAPSSPLIPPTHKVLLPVGVQRSDLFGHGFIGVFRSLVTELRACVLHPGPDTENRISDLDQVFRAALETISESEALLAAQYIETRVLKSSIGYTVTRSIWSRETNFFFLRAVKKFVVDQSCLIAVREVISCSHYLRTTAPFDPAFDSQPLWNAILNSIQPSADVGPIEESWTLSTLIKIMILQEPTWSDPKDATGMEPLDMSAFVTRYINPSIQQSKWGDSAPFISLISELLEALDSPVYPAASQSDALTILDHIGHYTVYGTIYGVEVTLLHRFALATKSLSEKWRNAPSADLLSILEFIWNMMWPTNHGLDISEALPHLKGDPEITKTSIEAIYQAAEIVKDTKEQLNEIAQSRTEETGLVRRRGLVRYEWPSHLAVFLDSMLVVWKGVYPYVLPLPPPTPSELTNLDQNDT